MNEKTVETYLARLALDVRDLDLAEHYAHILREYGFKVVGVASRGVSFEGEAPVFSNVFQSKVVTHTAPRFSAPPTLPDSLSDHVASVYFPTQPSFVGSAQVPHREEST